MITHPLFNDALPRLMRPGEEGRENMAVEKAREHLAEIEKREAWDEAIFEHAPDHRLAALLRYAEKLSDNEYWRLASEVWTGYVFTFTQLQEWHSILTSSRPGRSAMMSEDERDALGKLPAVVRIFRGFDYKDGQRGYSWTLDMDVARRFAREGITGGAQMVAEGEVDRDAIIALLLRSGEAEVVVNIDHVRISDIVSA